MRVLLRPAAASDVEEAFRWYEERRAGLGTEFLAAVQKALDELMAHPRSYSVIYRDTRRVLLHRFPYGVYYRVYDEVIVLVACMHGRRSPMQWKART